MWLALALTALVAGCGDQILGVPSGNASLGPTVTITAPANLATGVALNSKVAATFSTAMDDTTLKSPAVNFTLTGPGLTPVPGTVTYPPGGANTAIFQPTSNLAGNIQYTATITTGAKDTAGNALATKFVWTFQTGATPDTTAPRVNLTAPASAVSGVEINRKVTATFNEAMDPATIDGASFTVKCAVPLSPPTCVDPAGVVTYAAVGTSTTFTPTVNLASNTTYTATITTAAKDLAGNALASGPVPNPWTFTTAASADTTAPRVNLTSPVDLATNVAVNKTISATFSESMDPASISTATYTLTGPGPTSVTGTVAYDPINNIATFKPLTDLEFSTPYTATITTGAKDLAGNALVTGLVPNPWTFTTAAAPITGPVIDLGLAAPFGIAATAGVTNTATAPNTTINGNVVLDPVSGATCNAVAIDAAGGFGPCGGFAPTLNGQVISPLFPDAGATSGAVVIALKAAYLSITPPAGPPAAGGLGGATNIPAGTTLGDVAGAPLVQGDNYFVPGVYQSLTSILITGDLTLDAQGDPNAVFVFQSSSTVGTAAGAASPGAHTRILLINGAKASNVWWQAGTSATLGTNTEFQGNILAAASITMTTGASSCGRLLAGAFTAGAFVFDSNVVSVPGNVNAPPTCQ